MNPGCHESRPAPADLIFVRPMTPSKPSKDRRTHHVFGFIGIFLCLTIAKVTLASETVNPGQASKDEQTLWNLERAYWRYVQDNDLSAYSNLWHKDFLGWPAVSAAPEEPEQVEAQTPEPDHPHRGSVIPAAHPVLTWHSLISNPTLGSATTKIDKGRVIWRGVGVIVGSPVACCNNKEAARISGA